MQKAMKALEDKFSFRAVCQKLKVITWREKIKLIAKIFLRIIGIHKPLFLGGYYLEEDETYQKEDEQLTQHLKNIIIDHKTKGSYIALVVHDLNRGGLEQVVKLLAMEWSKTGIQVKVICMNEGGETADSLKHMGIEVVCFHLDLEQLKNYLLINRPIIANTHFVFEGLEIFYGLGIPIIEVIHNMYVFMNHNLLLREDYKHRYISHYIAVSQRAKDIFLQKFNDVSENRVTVIGNSFLPEMQEKKNRDLIRKDLGIAPDSFVYIAVGSIDARKNYLGILRAVAILEKITDKNIKLIIAGAEADREYVYKIKKFIKKTKLQDIVLMLGNRTDINDLLGAADAFLLLSYYEGWSLAATEAVVSGIPIIHSDCGSGKELTENGAGLLVPNPLDGIEDYQSYDLYNAMHAGKNEHLYETVNAMLQVLRDKDEWIKKRKQMQKNALNYFSGEKVAEKYIDVFRQFY